MSEPIEGVYLFVEVGPDGAEGIVGMGVLGGDLVLPLVTTSPGTANIMKQFARQHAAATNLRVEMRYIGGPAKLIETFDP